MNANLTEMREVTGDEQQTVEGGGRFGIQELMSRYFQDETLAPQVPITLTHEPTAQRA